MSGVLLINRRIQTNSRVVILRLLALAVGVILCRSSMYHVGNNYAFLATVYSYQLNDQLSGLLVASVLPYLQLMVGLGLLFFQQIQKPSFAIAAGLFLIFSTVQTITWWRGLNISCGCFSPAGESRIGLESISLPLGLAIASLIGWRLSPPLQPNLNQGTSRSS